MKTKFFLYRITDDNDTCIDEQINSFLEQENASISDIHMIEMIHLGYPTVVAVILYKGDS